MYRHRAIVFAALTSAALACESEPSPIVRAAGVERRTCDERSTPQSEVELLKSATVLEAEPIYGHIFDANHANISKQVIGAKLLVRPPAGLRPDQMARALQCHSARVLLGQVSAAAVPDDPSWLPDAWVDIDVIPENGEFAVLLTSSKLRYNLELLRRTKRFANDRALAARSTTP
jgi:hypothetical protein